MRATLEPANDAGLALDFEQRDTLKRALGLDHKRSAYRNRVAFNVRREGIVAAVQLEGFGLLIQDRPEHYGSMRVYRVTRSGFAALGVARPKRELLALAERAAEASIAADSPPLPGIVGNCRELPAISGNAAARA